MIIDIIGIAGACLIVAGAAMVYIPAGFLTAGALMLAAAVIGARRNAPKEHK